MKLNSILVLFLLLGCSNSSEPEELNELVRDFYLSNAAGIRTTTFKSSEDIIFNYMFINNTEDSLQYGLTHSGPFVSFVVMKDSLKIGSTTDGYGFLLNAPMGVMLPGDTMWARHSWLPNKYHDKLQPSNYTAHAKLHISFKDHVWNGTGNIDFFILKF